MEGRRIHITGVVQGVGFRPFVSGLAARYELEGWVCNTSAGVDIAVEGPAVSLDAFITELSGDPPSLALIEAVEVTPTSVHGLGPFTIRPSYNEPGASLPVSPDVAVCEACLREMRDPDDRRYRHPFINCTDCGPRFTIILDIPYDRPSTTMSGFPLCDTCAAEYADPTDRRYHAQPVACPDCGPQVWLVEDGVRTADREEAIERARALLASGGILAVKGLGGFHLACDARDESAVARLRERKRRDGKPFALMAADEDAIAGLAVLEDAARSLLASLQAPVVILPVAPAGANRGSARRPVAPSVNPGLNTLGVMLPYTPLHHLLLERTAGHPDLLVMKSGNLSE